MTLAEHLPDDGLVLRQIMKSLCDLCIFTAKVSNDHIQVCHMVIGQTLNFLLLHDGHVLLSNLCLQVLAPLFDNLQLIFTIQQIFDGLRFLLVLLHVLEIALAMNIGLECHFHLHEDFLQFCTNSKVLENLFLTAFQHIFISSIEVKKISEM